MNHTQRDRLLDELAEGQITEADFLRLEAELTLNPASRKAYYRRQQLSIMLENLAESEGGAPSVSAGLNDRSRLLRVRSMRRLFAVAAGLLGLVAWYAFSPPETSSLDATRARAADAQEEQATGYGVLVGQIDAKWSPPQTLNPGALLPLHILKLESGVAQIELFSGVNLVIEGRAEFRIASPMDVVITRGRLRANVPAAAHGFQVQTARGKVVDLGTEFALDISDERSELHVLDGEIEWHANGQSARKMLEGDGIRHVGNQASSLTADPGQFLSAEEVRNKFAFAQSSKRQRWERYGDQLRDDDRLVALYRMAGTENWQRRLPNLAAHGKQLASEGAIVAAQRSPGRWADDGAVNFSPTGSRVRMNIAGEFGSLSLLCWVRINSLDRWYNSLFLTDGHDQHEPHWQIVDDGRLFFSVKKRDQWDAKKGEKDKHIYYSPPFWDSTLSGRWIMIATVYDLDAGMVTHYLNGETLSQEAIPASYLVPSVRIGNASLGNWGLPEKDDPQFAVRNFNGSMDEFALFSAALSAEEIQEHYDNGKP